MEWIFALLAGYVLGSVPFGIILTRIAGAGDLRAIGSGNIGATNVLRTGRKGLAAATLLLDLAKGLAAVVLADAIWPGLGVYGALGAVIGHCYPAWLKFHGGKGVATLAGVCFGLAWPVGLVYAVLWIGVLAISRVSSLGGMSAAIGAPLAAFAFGLPIEAVALTILAALVVFKHRENIARLRAGTEPRVGSKKG